MGCTIWGVKALKKRIIFRKNNYDIPNLTFISNTIHPVFIMFITTTRQKNK